MFSVSKLSKSQYKIGSTHQYKVHHMFEIIFVVGNFTKLESVLHYLFEDDAKDGDAFDVKPYYCSSPLHSMLV
ncbi:hypothetical protein PV327_004077 [Microctonus hyperodae]|uniref:Uncharacterized protein n=1 Tax=Microctonus hyperodae TaxID=165561 RepID=A0AA39KM75_MICHY|nr:hypothetical protein PV327_004077 [Microctonus hyperodae]